MSDGAWMLAEAIAENATGGAALKNKGVWYECERPLWQFSAWKDVEFQAREDRTVCGLRRARDDGPERSWDANGAPV